MKNLHDKRISSAFRLCFFGLLRTIMTARTEDQSYNDQRHLKFLILDLKGRKESKYPTKNVYYIHDIMYIFQQRYI